MEKASINPGSLGNITKDKFKKPDQQSGIFFLTIGLTVCYFSFQIGLGSPSKPGPGFMPFLGGLFLALLSAILVLKVLLRDTAPFWEIKGNLGNVFLVLSAMVAYGYLLNRVGFVFVTFGFVAFLIRFIKPQSWVKSIIGGVLSAGASYLLFETLLKSQLPRTFLGFF